jgi:hypothetical protein
LDNDRADGKPMLVVSMEEDLQEAAQARLKLMYEETLPQGLTALQLAKVGKKTSSPHAETLPEAAWSLGYKGTCCIIWLVICMAG